MDSKVEFYCEQPCKVDVFVDGMMYSTTFDTYVFYKDGREEMQEVKYAEELAANNERGERDRAQIEKQKLWCTQNGINYAVRTDNIILSGNFTIRNLEWLAAKARRYSMTNDMGRKMLTSYLRENGNFTIGQLYTCGIITTKNGLNLLADMYYRGEITFGDIDNNQMEESYIHLRHVRLHWNMLVSVAEIRVSLIPLLQLLHNIWINRQKNRGVPRQGATS